MRKTDVRGALSERQTDLNLGNPAEFTIRELAAIELTGSKSTLTFLPLDDHKQRRHWQPTVHLRDGLRQTIARFDQLLSSGRAERGAYSGTARVKLRSRRARLRIAASAAGSTVSATRALPLSVK
jgi:hypothetical protein